MAGISTVPVYAPQAKVTLYKTIGRTTLDGTLPTSERFRGTDRTIDLTPWLTDSGGVQISKGVREPAGAFSITIADKAFTSKGAAASFETLYGLIEPMDMIEIRLAHDAPKGSDIPLPIMMRGFVSNVTRSESLDGGAPQRHVTISGQDYGKIWQQLQILYLPGYLLGEDILTGFQLFEHYDVDYKNVLSGGDFLQQVVDKIMTPYLLGLMPSNTSMPTTFSTDIKVKHGVTSIMGPQSQEGSIYDLLRTYLDVGPWNEMFIEDRAEGVYVVYRPNPALQLDGKTLIQMDSEAPDTVMPDIIDLSDQEIVSLTLNRTDANVANYYWTRMPRFDLVSDNYRALFAVTGADRDTVLLDKYGNTAVNLYGMRPMYADTQMGGDDIETFNSGQSRDAQTSRDTSMVGWIKARRAALVLQNKDNVVLENGNAVVRGRPELRAGVYVRLRRGSTQALYYVSGVDHAFTPYMRWLTTLTLTRGLGFVERSQKGGGKQSPYLAEMLPTPKAAS
jgi:hypothetical protein